MLSYIIWFIVALIIVIIEMNLMSFYLMAVALGAAAGGITAYMSYDITIQGIVAGIVTIIASCGSFYLRHKLKTHQDKMNNELDRGQRVVVKADRLREDGSALVSYRGADWIAYKEDSALTAGIYFIARIDGTRLILGDKLPAAATTTTEDTITENENTPPNTENITDTTLNDSIDTKLTSDNDSHKF